MLRRTSSPVRWRRLHGGRSALERLSVVHGRLKILGVAQLHVHPNVIREATNEEFGALARRQVLGVACHRLEPVSEVLDRRGEREPTQLGQSAAADRGPEA